MMTTGGAAEGEQGWRREKCCSHKSQSSEWLGAGAVLRISDVAEVGLVRGGFFDGSHDGGVGTGEKRVDV